MLPTDRTLDELEVFVECFHAGVQRLLGVEVAEVLVELLLADGTHVRVFGGSDPDAAAEEGGDQWAA